MLWKKEAYYRMRKKMMEERYVWFVGGIYFA
jgi:hypothetical protein